MSQRTRSWQCLLIGASLWIGCNKSPESSEKGPITDAKCSKDTACPFGYDCVYEDGVDPNNPKSIGKCVYVECALTALCEKKFKECALPQETAMCDKFKVDKYCECIRPSSQEVPSTPTTGGSPTTGDKP